jgi:hypothetical protein
VARTNDRVWLLLQSTGTGVPQLRLRKYGHRVDFFVNGCDDGAVLSVAAPCVQQTSASAVKQPHAPFRPPAPENDCGEQERKWGEPKCQWKRRKS